jgi:hypothetical protein
VRASPPQAKTVPDLRAGLHDGYQERTGFINYDAAPELHVSTSPFHTGELSRGRYGHFYVRLYIPLMVLHNKAKKTGTGGGGEGHETDATDRGQASCGRRTRSTPAAASNRRRTTRCSSARSAASRCPVLPPPRVPATRPVLYARTLINE